MSNSVFVQFQLDLATAAGQILPPDNIVIGEVEFLEHKSFYQRVADRGFHLVIGLPEGDVTLGGPNDLNGTFKLVCELLYPRPADISSDYTDVYNTISQLMDAWVDFAPWATGENRAPTKITFKKPEIKYHEKPFGEFLKTESFIVCSKFEMTMALVGSQVAAPYVTMAGAGPGPVFPQGTP